MIVTLQGPLVGAETIIAGLLKRNPDWKEFRAGKPDVWNRGALLSDTVWLVALTPSEVRVVRYVAGQSDISHRLFSLDVMTSDSNIRKRLASRGATQEAIQAALADAARVRLASSQEMLPLHHVLNQEGRFQETLVRIERWIKAQVRRAQRGWEGWYEREETPNTDPIHAA